MSDLNRSIHLVRIPTERGHKFAYPASSVNVAVSFVVATGSVNTGLEVQGYYHSGTDGYVYYRLVNQEAQTTRTGYRTAQAVLADLRSGNYDLNTGEWIGGIQE